MDAKRMADELASRCVALVVYYQHVRKRHPDRVGIEAEYRAVAREAMKGKISAPLIASKVATELLARFEPVLARSLHGEFVRGFTTDAALNLVTAPR